MDPPIDVLLMLSPPSLSPVPLTPDSVGRIAEAMLVWVGGWDLAFRVLGSALPCRCGLPYIRTQRTKGPTVQKDLWTEYPKETEAEENLSTDWHQTVNRRE